MKILKNKLAFIALCVVACSLLFQNCSTHNLGFSNQSPNNSPLSASKNEAGVTALPGTIKKKMINGVEVPGFDPGSFIYILVKDACVMDRKTIIQNNPIYLADSFLKANFDFNKPIGSYDVSMVMTKTTEFISSAAIDDASRLDSCLLSLIVSNSNFEVTLTGGSKSGNQNSAWAEMGLTNSVLSQLANLNKNTKVNVGLTVPGISNSVGIPFSNMIDGITFNDPNGDGTYFANLIAAPLNNNFGTRGAASEVAQITPSIIKNGILNPVSFFNSMKELVNRGAQVILIPQEIIPNDQTYCNPMVGEALYLAVERGATIVVQAGTETKTSKGPGEIVGPRDYNLWQESKTNFPACWARYFRGVISVGGKKSGPDGFIAKSNWGADGIEILAPSENVIGTNHQNTTVKADSPASGAALTTAAVAHIISFYKSKGWFYSPWLIEDILMNGSRASTVLPKTGQTVRLQKVLDFSALATYLAGLNVMSENDARLQISDNPEAGQSINLSSVSPTEKPIRLDVFTKVSDVYYKDRVQFQAVYYYASGAVKVVTDKVNWTSSNPTDFSVDQNGIVYPKKIGQFKISAVDPATRLTGSFAASAVDYDRISGQNDKISEVFLVPDNNYQTDSFTKIDSTHYRLKSSDLSFKVRARYQSGVVRSIVNSSSYSFVHDGEPLLTIGDPFGYITSDSLYLGAPPVPLYGNSENDLFVFYRGEKFNFKIFVEPYTFAGWFWDVQLTNSPKTVTVLNTPPNNVIAVSETSRKFYQNIHYWNLGKVALCDYANGNRDACFGYPNLVIVKEYIDTTTSTLFTMTTYGSKNYKPPTLGHFSVNHKMNFRGSGSNQVKIITTDAEIIPVQLTTVISSMAFDIRHSFVQNMSPNGTHYSNQNQLAPACLALGYELKSQNLDLGLDSSLDSAQGWPLNPTTGSVSFTSNQTVFNSIIGSPGSIGFILPLAVSQLSVKFTEPRAPVSRIIASDYKFTDDPNSSTLSGTGNLAALNYTTPKLLPAAPPVKPIDSLCNSPNRNSSGFKAGTGTQSSPILICSYDDLQLFANLLNTPSNFNNRSAILGNDIDLGGKVPTLQSDGVKTFLPRSNLLTAFLDGKNYRVMNANFVDREAKVTLLNINAKNLYIYQNSLVAKEVSLIGGSGGGSGIVENIYAYENTVEAEIYSGVGFDARSVFTKNQVSYLSGAQTVGHSAIGSFSQDTVRYIGIVGSGVFNGLAKYAAYSGSSSNITGGGKIAGVSGEFCYKCFSKVVINSANAWVIGGIIGHSTLGLGNIEVGESQANITSAGNAIVGGVIGKVEYGTTLSQTATIAGVEFSASFGHTHLINSKFSGSISGSFIIGGLIGSEETFTPPIFTNNEMTGTLIGPAAKIGGYIGSMVKSCNTEKRAIRTRNTTVNGGYSPVGNYYGSPGGTLVPY